MSYTMNVNMQTTARELPDMWSPFALNKYGPDNVFVTPLDPGHGDTPYIGMCYTDNGNFVTEVDQLGWSAVSGLNARSSDIQSPNETIEGHTLMGLEPGIYQCVFVDMLYCDECEDPDECICDMTVGWALMRVDDE